MEKISYRGLKKVMNPKEMKNVLGGSEQSCIVSCYGYCNFLDTYGMFIHGHCGFDNYTFKCNCFPEE